MKSINLFALTKSMTLEEPKLYEQGLSERDKTIRYDICEVKTINLLVKKMLASTSLKVESYGYFGWFYSFVIPQINKEFDLIKIDKADRILNVELKSQMVPEEAILNQLKKNCFYLSTIKSEVYCLNTALL